MYQVCYYINKQPHKYGYLFNTIWGATFKARTIFEEHGFATDVMNTHTGEILVIFEPGNTYVDADLEVDIQAFAIQPLE